MASGWISALLALEISAAWRPAEDHGFMYSRDIHDPAGNVIAFMWMEPEAAAKGPAAYMAEQSQS